MFHHRQRRGDADGGSSDTNKNSSRCAHGNGYPFSDPGYFNKDPNRFAVPRPAPGISSEPGLGRWNVGLDSLHA